MTGRGEPPMSVKIPADIDRPDKIVYGLTARQVGIVACTGGVVLWGWLTFQTLVPLPVLVGLGLPAVAAGCVLAVAQHDGMSLDRFVAAALAFMRAPREQVSTDEPVQAPPGWCRIRGRLPAPLRLPVHAVRSDGVMELAAGGTAVLVRAGTVPFGLRTPGEQAGLVAMFGRWLNSLDTGVQILLQARPIDLSGLADHLTGHAAALPDPALQQAAHDHVTFLAGLGERHELLNRHVLIVIGDTIAHSAAHSALRPARPQRPARVSRDAGAAVALRRAAEAVAALTALGVAAEVLDADACTAVLAASLSPGDPRPVGNAAPNAPITARQEP